MVIKKGAKTIIGVILYILFLDFWVFIFSRILYYASRLLFLKEWKYNIAGVPSFFKHQINFNSWRFNPNEWSFTLRGVHAREKMFPNCKVLDLGCGDGSYSFLFFADISSHIDAIDFDSSAISYASRYYEHPKINYQKINIIDQPFPADDYDVIVWNAGICYFTIEQIYIILNKIANAGKSNMVLCGMLPRANGHVDHKMEFQEASELRDLFSVFFKEVNIKEIIEGNSTNIVTFYFNMSHPKNLKEISSKNI